VQKHPHAGEGAEKKPRQFVQYAFFKVDPAWRRLPSAEKDAGKREFIAVCDDLSGRLAIHKTYSLTGVRGDTDFLLWSVSDTLETLHELGTRLNATGLGKWLDSPYKYLAMTRESIYIKGHEHEGQEGARTRMSLHNNKYLFVYPFVKMRKWYALPMEQRRKIMGPHFRIGHEFPSVSIHTAYSYGLDDQEFMLGFETDHPQDFLDLVMSLRDTEASAYTERETPIFTCIAMDLPRVLDALG